MATVAQLRAQSEAASDRSARRQPADAPFSWSGFYFGGNLGLNWGEYDLGHSYETVVFVTSDTNNIPGFRLKDSEVLGGGQLGYNQQFGKFVLGIEGDFDGTSLSSSSGGLRIFPIGPGMSPSFAIQRSVKTDWMALARARAGFAWERFLFYGTGGAAFADVAVHASDFNDGNLTSQAADDEATVVGWTAGVGVEWAAARVVTLGLEYRHSDFGSRSFDLATTGASISAHSTNVDFTDDQVTFRVNLLFNGLFRR